MQAEAYDPDNVLTDLEKEAFERRSKEQFESNDAFVVGFSLVREANRIYLKQAIYNLMVLRRRFGIADSRNLPDHPYVRMAVRDVRQLLIDRQIVSYSKDELSREIDWFNQDVRALENLCYSYEVKIDELQGALAQYMSWGDPNLDPKKNAELLNILYPEGYNTNIVGLLYQDQFKKRIRDENQIASYESAPVRYILSKSTLGALYDAGTSLKASVGYFNNDSCGMEPVRLKELTVEDIEVIHRSVLQMEKKYLKSIDQLIEDIDNDDIWEVLIKYIQENPTSIQLAILMNPDPRQVHLISGLMMSEEFIQKIHRARDIGIGILTLPLFWMKGLWAARAVFLMSTYFTVSTALDIRTSYHIEDRIKLAMISGQITRERGLAILSSLEDQRPYSYLNLALAGLSTTLNGIRLKQLTDMNNFVAATTNGGVQQGSEAAKLMSRKFTTPNADPFKTYKPVSPAGEAAQELGENALQEALTGTALSKGAPPIPGPVFRPPVPRLPPSSAESALKVPPPGPSVVIAQEGRALRRSTSSMVAVLDAPVTSRLIGATQTQQSATSIAQAALPMRPLEITKIERIAPLHIATLSTLQPAVVLKHATVKAADDQEQVWVVLNENMYKPFWQLLQEALSGKITIEHIQALSQAAKVCEKMDKSLSDELCAAVGNQLAPRALKRTNRTGNVVVNGYTNLKGFDISPTGFIKWWRTLKYIKHDDVVVKNPFTSDEIQKINFQFKMDVIAAIAKKDPVAMGSVEHMEEHLSHADLYSDYIQSMGIDLDYYRLLVNVHDAGKFIPSQRVIDAANGHFLNARIMWHDQSTADYLLDIGERLNIPSAKIEHLIADIIGHNDGSGLKKIFWTTFFPNYGMPRRLEGDVMTLFDRFGQGNWAGARKIAPQAQRPTFAEKVDEAYNRSPANTIRQLEAIYKRALSRLEQRSVGIEGSPAEGLKEMYEYAVEAQSATVRGYQQLQWSENNTVCTITAKGETAVAHDLTEFLAEPFQKVLRNSN